jgi:hypothetical protein
MASPLVPDVRGLNHRDTEAQRRKGRDNKEK